MKLSEQRRSNVYKAIADPIMELRITYHPKGDRLLDDKLFRLQSEIWHRVHEALNLEGPK